MTSAAYAFIGSEILEEGIFRCYRGAVWLEGRDNATRVPVCLQLRNHKRCLLSARASIGEKPPHFLGVRDRAGARGGRAIGLQALRDCEAGGTGVTAKVAIVDLHRIERDASDLLD